MNTHKILKLYLLSLPTVILILLKDSNLNNSLCLLLHKYFFIRATENKQITENSAMLFLLPSNKMFGNVSLCSEVLQFGARYSSDNNIIMSQEITVISLGIPCVLKFHTDSGTKRCILRVLSGY